MVAILKGVCRGWSVLCKSPFFFSRARASTDTGITGRSRSWKGANGSHWAADGVPETFEPCAAVGIGFFGAVGQKVAGAAECFEIVWPVVPTGGNRRPMVTFETPRPMALRAAVAVSREDELPHLEPAPVGQTRQSFRLSHLPGDHEAQRSRWGRGSTRQTRGKGERNGGIVPRSIVGAAFHKSDAALVV